MRDDIEVTVMTAIHVSLQVSQEMLGKVCPIQYSTSNIESVDGMVTGKH